MGAFVPTCGVVARPAGEWAGVVLVRMTHVPLPLLGSPVRAPLQQSGAEQPPSWGTRTIADLTCHLQQRGGAEPVNSFCLGACVPAACRGGLAFPPWCVVRGTPRSPCGTFCSRSLF